MKILLKYLLCGISFLPGQSILQAQDPVDCTNAIPVCNSQQLNFNSNGPGMNDFGPGPNDNSNGCLSGDEHQSAWFLIYISSGSAPNATLAFTIDPSGGMWEDYDFALYGPNVDCSGLGAPLRCSWAAGGCGFCPETGLGMGTVDFSEDAGGDGFVAEVQTQPGETYILLVDNYNSSSQGFFLDWTGTAELSCSCSTLPIITGELEICTGESTVLTATGTDLVTYQWAATGGGSISGPTNTASINATMPGTYTVTVTDDEDCTGTASVEVTDAPAPEIDYTVQPSTCGQSNGEIDITITGNSGPYDFDWSNGDDTEDLSGVPEGSYSLTVTSDDGCTGTITIDITDDNPALIISGIIEDNTNCTGGNGSISTTVTPPGIYTYEWSNGETTPDIFDLTPGTYALTVSSEGSCTGTMIFTIDDEPNEPQIISSTVPSLCGLANGEIDITIIDGVPPYEFLWSDGETTEDLMDVAAGNYSVTVTGDNGCSTVVDIVLMNDNPSIDVNANIGPNTSCDVPNGTIFTTITPPVFPTGEPYVFSWSNGSSDQNLTGLAPGTYTLTVSGGGSCTQVVIFTVPDTPDAPDINANIVPANCGEDNGAIQTNINGGIPPFSYIWNDGSTSSNLSDLPAGNYSVTVTGNNGCSDEASFIVPDEPIIFIVNPDIEPNTLCTGGNGSISVTVIPNGTYTYEWNTGENGTVITNLLSGNYTLTVSAGGTCEQVHVFTVPDDPEVPEFNFDITESTCDEIDGGATVIIIGGAGPFTYLWSNGETTTGIQNVIAGVYTVTVTGVNECSTIATVVIPNIQVDIVINESITANTSCLTGNGAIDLTVSPTSGLAFQWSNGESTPDIDDLTPGTYVLTVSAGGSCEEVFSYNVPDDITIPIINLTPASATCGQANGAIDLTMSEGQAPFEYEWSNGENFDDLADLLSGTYTVTVTDALGCSSSASATVNNNSIQIIITGFIEPNTSCDSPNGEINISIAPAGSYTYNWSNGEDVEDLSDLDPGTYTVTVTLGSCSASETFSVGNQTSDPVISAEVTPAICDDDNGSIDITVSGSTPPYMFFWSTGETSEDITDLFPDTYSVTVTSANDCSTVLTVNVPNNSTDFLITGSASPLTSCLQSNGSVDLAIDPPDVYNIIWSNGETTEDINNLTAGDYSVTVSQSGSCNASATFTITDETSIPSFSSTITFDQCDLGIGFITLTNITADGPFTISWADGESTATIDSLSSGNYTVTITDINGCSASSGYVMVSNNTDIMISGSTMPNTLCTNPNGSIDINVSPVEAYTFLWSNGGITEDISGLASGNYSVTVSLGSCTSMSTFNVGADASAISLNGTASDVGCNGGNDGAINLDLAGGVPPYTVEWNPSIPGFPEDPTALLAGTYSVTITDQAGCSSTSVFTISEPVAIILACTQTSSVSVPGAQDGSGGIQISGGTPPYAITWTPGSSQSGLPQGEFDIFSLSEGVYDVQVVDANGCISTCSFTITAEDCMTAIGSMDPVSLTICGEGCASAVYDTSGQVLNTGDIIQFILHEGAGNQIQNEIARADQPQFCFNAALMQFNEQYYISAVAGPDDGTGNVLLSFACAQTSSGTPVVFRGIPQASIDAPDMIDCDNPEIELTGNSNIPFSTFWWSTKNGNILTDSAAQIIRINKGGGYELVVSAYTCRDTTGVDVEVSDDYPSLIIGPVGDLNCRDRLVTLSGTSQQADVELIWATINGSDTTIIGTGDTVVVNAPGTYYLLGVADNGCMSSMDIQVEELISMPYVDAGEDVTLNCNQTTLEITAISSDDVAYLWTPPTGVQLPVDDMSSLSIDQPGLYIVIVTDTLTYCTGSDIVEVFQSQEAPVSTVVVRHVTCFGAANGSITVQPEQGQAPFTFFINGDNYGNTGIFTSLAAGLYSLEVLNSNGCRWVTEVEITEPELLNVSIGPDLFVQPGDLITLEVQMNISPARVSLIEWTQTEVINCMEDPCISIRFSLFETAEIGVTVTDTNGCFASDQLLVTVIDNEKVFVPNIFSPNDDGQNDIFTLFSGSGVQLIQQLSVFTRWGELVFRKENFSPNDLSVGWDGTHGGKPLNPGLYVWRAEVVYQDGDEKLFYGDVTLVR